MVLQGLEEVGCFFRKRVDIDQQQLSISIEKDIDGADVSRFELVLLELEATEQ